MDNHKRDCLAIDIGKLLTGEDIVTSLNRIAQQGGRPLPGRIQADKGPAFISTISDKCSCDQGLTSMQEARQKPENLRHDYNYFRPHYALSDALPVLLVRQFAPFLTSRKFLLWAVW